MKQKPIFCPRMFGYIYRINYHLVAFCRGIDMQG
uniref:Uncharacterized protein n=1 Tax=Anguilla anguilla TaxID=7936 RepID=A0A0E9V9C2_ANGAN